MIKIIYGAQGTGKTKQLVDAANKNAVGAKGLSVFISDSKRCIYDVSRDIRFIDVTDWAIAGEDALCGFVKGIAACNSDHEFIYIDGLARIAGKPVSSLSAIFYMLDKVSCENNITITVTCSCDKADLPDFVKKFI